MSSPNDPDLLAEARRIASQRGCVAVDSPPDPYLRMLKWHYVIESLVGGLTDEGIAMWIERNFVHDDLDDLVEKCNKIREAMVAT